MASGSGVIGNPRALQALIGRIDRLVQGRAQKAIVDRLRVGAGLSRAQPIAKPSRRGRPVRRWRLRPSPTSRRAFSHLLRATAASAFRALLKP